MKATRGQIDKLEDLNLALGHALTKNSHRRLERLSKEEASQRITLLAACVRVKREAAIRTPSALATAAQIEHLGSIRHKLRDPVGVEELPHLFGMTRTDMSILTQEAQLRLQAQNDAHGVPMPDWRSRMVNIKPETAMRVEAARRNAERRIEN